MYYSLLNYLWFFIIYSFLGWAVEVAFHAVTSAKFINRGFLNGPVCPIYGFGMILLIFFLEPFVDNFILLFIGAFLLTSILEFITGFILEKIFDTKWWDYSNMPFNIKGYICLSFSIAWGLAGVFMLDIIHPAVAKFSSFFNNTLGNISLILFFIYFTADFILTVQGILKINKRNLMLADMERRLTLYSEDIGESIYRGVSTAIKARENLHQKIEDSKSEFIASQDEIKKEHAKLKVEYDQLLKTRNYVHRRLEKSFPNIRKHLSSSENDKACNLKENKKN